MKCLRWIFLFAIFTAAFLSACLIEDEAARTTCTVSMEDFQQLIQERENGLAGYHKNIDTTSLVAAPDDAVLNWSTFPQDKRERLKKREAQFFRKGKITMIVMAGGEATRFGGPKTFVNVSSELGDFLEIKAANLRWVHNKFQTSVPMYLLSSEKRLNEFKKALVDRRYYGLTPDDFRWYVQGTVDTFIPTDHELHAHFHGPDLEQHVQFAQALRQANPDGIYRFKGEPRKIPSGHFDAIASFIISGLLSEALSRGIEYAVVVNIDNLQALLKNDGMIAYFAEKGDDVGFILAEKNLVLTIKNLKTGKMIHPKLNVRFRERVISFNGIEEHVDFAEKDDYRFVLDSLHKTVDVFDIFSGLQIETEIKIKPETGGTLVQPLDQNGKPFGKPVLREGFELPSHFDHADAAFFNTNTVILRLKSLLRLMDVSKEQLAAMDFEERTSLVRDKLLKKVKTFFEFKNHEVEGEFPEFGIVKNGKTKIPVSQLTRILLQVGQLDGIKVGYLFAPRKQVFAPVKEPEDKQIAAEQHAASLKEFTLYEQSSRY